MTESGRSRKWNWWLIGVIAAGCVLALGLIGTLVFRFDFDAYKIPSEAMVPSVNRGDRVLARHFSGNVARSGDIVVFRAMLPNFSVDAQGNVVDGTPSPGTRISRVIAVGGDRIDTLDGRVRINGQVLDEPYLAPGTETDRLRPQVIPAGKLFIMGDNRPQVRDSRYDGPIDSTAVTGRVAYVNAPLDWIALALVAGSVFALVVLFVARARRRRRATTAPQPDAPPDITEPESLTT